MADTGELTELGHDECLRLLADALIGRVVFTEAALPAAHPVTYLLDGGEVVFRTANGAKLAAATLHHVVAFQVDDVDPAARTGWSVLGVGEAYEVTDPRRLADLAARLPAPWAANHDGHTVAIPLQRLTGRVLSPDTSGVPGPAPDGVGELAQDVRLEVGEPRDRMHDFPTEALGSRAGVVLGEVAPVDPGADAATAPGTAARPTLTARS